MGETITIRTGAATEVIKVIEQGPQGPQGPKGDPGDVAGLPLTTTGDTLYRANSTTNARLPIGTTGQVLKVSSGGIPEWGAAPASGVTSVNGESGAVSLSAADVGAAETLHAAEHQDGEADQIMASAVIVDTSDTSLNGVYVPDGTLVGGRIVYYRPGTRKNTKIEYKTTNNFWTLINNTVAVAQSPYSEQTNPWSQEPWEDLAGGIQLDFINVTQASLEKLARSTTENLGTAALTDSNSFAASSHTHGNITNSGAVGSVSGLPLKTGTNGVIEAGSFGTAAGSFCEGNDARLSDDRDPNLHAASHLPDGADELFDQSLNTTDSVAFSGFTIGDGAVIPVGANYGQFTSADSNVGFIINRGQNGNYASLDFLEGGSGESGWSIQLQPSNDDLTFVNRVAGSNQLTLPATGDVGCAFVGDISVEDKENGVTATFVAQDNLSDDRSYQLPDANGTLALTTDNADQFGSGAATDGWVLTADGAGGAAWEAATGGGGGDTVSIETSAADILSVSSGAISADDAGATRIVYWNDTNNKLAYGTPSDVGAAASSHTHSDATQSVAGFLSTADKTKLDGIASGANNYTHPNHTGDVTSAGDGATTIANNAVTNAKLAQVASSTLKGRATAGTGNAEDLTASQVRTILNVADGAEVNVNADWNASSGDAQILNKPTLGTAAAAATTDFAAASHTHPATAISDSTTAGRALLTAADASAQRTSLSLGNSATLDTGTTAGTVAAGNHSHELTSLAATGATNGHVLTANGSGGVTFSAASGGVSGVDSTTADVFSVSGSNLVADDGGLIDSANPFVQWNDTSGKLVYANPLSRPSGAMYLGVAPTTSALGTRALCIQADRSLAADRVPTGTDSLAIGNSSQAQNNGSTAVGFRARANNTYAVCIGGESLANGNASVAIGAVATATGAQSINISAYDAYSGNSSTATNSVGLNATADLRAMFATAAFRAVYWGGQTTSDAANVELNLDATATNRMVIAANTAVIADIFLIARRTDNSKFLAARRWVAIRRDGSNNTALIGAVQTIGTDQSEGSPTWTFTIDADDTASVESLRVRVTGAASETVNWRVCAIYRVVA